MNPKKSTELTIPSHLEAGDDALELSARFAEYGEPSQHHRGGNWLEVYPFGGEAGDPCFMEEVDDAAHAREVLADLHPDDVA